MPQLRGMRPDLAHCLPPCCLLCPQLPRRRSHSCPCPAAISTSNFRADLLHLLQTVQGWTKHSGSTMHRHGGTVTFSGVIPGPEVTSVCQCIDNVVRNLLTISLWRETGSTPNHVDERVAQGQDREAAVVLLARTTPDLCVFGAQHGDKARNGASLSCRILVGCVLACQSSTELLQHALVQCFPAASKEAACSEAPFTSRVSAA